MTLIDKQLDALDTKRELIKKVIMYLSSSKMSVEEKKMRIAMLPYMEEQHIVRLVDILEREINEYTNLYINALNTTIV